MPPVFNREPFMNTCSLPTFGVFAKTNSLLVPFIAPVGTSLVTICPAVAASRSAFRTASFGSTGAEMFLILLFPKSRFATAATDPSLFNSSAPSLSFSISIVPFASCSF